MLSAQYSSEKLNVKIYPNPVSNILNIKSDGNISSDIFDMNGRKVLTSDSKNIDVQKLPSGIYSLKITTVKSSKILKFLKN